MPYVYINSASEQEFEYVAKELVEQMAPIFNIGPERFVFIKNENKVINMKKEWEYVFIKIFCLERPEDLNKAMADLLINSLKTKFNRKTKVMFLPLEKKNMFE